MFNIFLMKRSNLGNNSYTIQTKFYSVEHETSRYFRDKKRENLRGKMISFRHQERDYWRHIWGIHIYFTAYHVYDQDGLQVNGKHQFLVYTRVNLSHTNVTTRKKNGKALLIHKQDTGPQINAKKIGLNIIQSKYYNIKIVNKSLKMW